MGRLPLGHQPANEIGGVDRMVYGGDLLHLNDWGEETWWEWCEQDWLQGIMCLFSEKP